jgi:hypothetical protein
LAAEQRPALEQLLFFNINQHRVRLGIQQSIETYGVPEIHECSRYCISGWSLAAMSPRP